MRGGDRPAHDAVDRGALIRTWAGAVLISFSAVYVRVADVEAARSSFLRVAYALPLFVVVLIVARRRREAAGPVLLPLAVVAGLFLGADLATWHISVGIIGAGLGTVLPNLQVVFVGVAGVLLFRERPRRGFWFALPIILAGVWLIGVVGRPVETGADVTLGILLGVLTAALYSGYLVVFRMARLRRPGVGSIEAMASATFGAVLATGAYALYEGVAAPAGSWPEDGWMLLYALGSQVVGWVLLASSIHRIPAALTSVALLLQPVLAMVWGGVLLGEPIGLPQWLGAAVALAGVVIAHRAVSLAASAEAAPADGVGDETEPVRPRDAANPRT